MFAAVCAATLLQGCIVLPIPWHWKHQDSYSGTVLDRETGQPIKGATVSSRGEGTFSAVAVTDETGAWVLPEVWDWHFGYVFMFWNDGTLIPYATGGGYKCALDDLTVSAPGYRTLEIPDFHDWRERKWFFDNGWLYDPDPNPCSPGKEFLPMTDPDSVPLAEQLANVSLIFKPLSGEEYIVRLAPESDESGSEPESGSSAQ